MSVRSRHALAAALASWCWAQAPSAEAAEKPKILVLPYQGLDRNLPEDLAEQTTAVIAKEIAAGEVSVIRADDVAAAAPKPETAQDAPQGDASAGSKAEALMAEAKDALQGSDFEKAQKLFQRAIKLLEDNADAVPDLRLLPEAYLQLAVVNFTDGREEEADDMLARAIHWDPERKLDESDYPPIFIRVFERARYNVLRRPRARIEVRGVAGSQVLFDGRNLGKTPLILDEALPGNHWIRVERPGEALRVRSVNVQPKKTVLVEFEGGATESAAPTGVLGALAANEVDRSHTEALRAAGSAAGADYVMAGAIYKTDTAYNIHTILVAVKDGGVGRMVDIAFDLDMLSAEIEVYKLAGEVRAQAESRKLTNVITDLPFALAPKFKKRPTRTAVAGKETKVTTVAAAPPTPDAPAAVAFVEPPPPPATGRGPVSVAPPPPPPPSAVIKDEAIVATTVLPKDEQPEEEGSMWWIWVVVGVAAAGAIGTGGYFLAQGGGSDEANLRITW